MTRACRAATLRNVKTLSRLSVTHDHYLTADDAPVYVPAAQWLDAVQRFVGGVRGYGFPHTTQWLKLTKSQRGRYEAYVDHGTSFTS